MTRRVGTGRPCGARPLVKIELDEHAWHTVCIVGQGYAAEIIENWAADQRTEERMAKNGGI